MHKYDYIKIGKRIRSERRKAGFARQDDFAEALGFSIFSRQTISKWERGKDLPDLDVLLKMCNLFRCELGYLLCEYDYKTRVVTDIHQAIGLSEKAIQVLQTLNHEIHLRDSFNTLNRIIEHPEFINLLKAIQLHNQTYVDKTFSPSPELRKILAKDLECNESEVEKIMESISESTMTSNLLNILHDLKKSKSIKRRSKDSH